MTRHYAILINGTTQITDVPEKHLDWRTEEGSHSTKKEGSWAWVPVKEPHGWFDVRFLPDRGDCYL